MLDLIADENIPRHQIPNRLTSVERRLHQFFSQNQILITCVGNIGTGKSSLVKFLAFNTGMNALFELPDEGFEDHTYHGARRSGEHLQVARLGSQAKRS